MRMMDGSTHISAEERVSHEGGPAEFLAVDAVADGIREGLAGGGELDLAAEARPVSLHGGV